MNDFSTAKTYALAATATGKKLAAQLAAGGATIVFLPTIETERLDLDEKSNYLLTVADDFDWLIFPDIFAADFFLQAFEDVGKDFFELDAVRVCTFGEAVADRLRFAQIHADVIANSIEPAAITASLVAYIGETALSGKRFLAVKKRSASSDVEAVEANLEKKGAIVSSIEIYAARITGALPRLKALLAGGAIDEFVFGAPADLLALREFLPDLTLPEILRDIRVSATDEVTLQNLREHNLEAHYFRENFRPLI